MRPVIRWALGLGALGLGFLVGAYWHDLVTPPERIYVCSWMLSDPVEDVESFMCSYNDEWMVSPR